MVSEVCLLHERRQLEMVIIGSSHYKDWDGADLGLKSRLLSYCSPSQICYNMIVRFPLKWSLLKESGFADFIHPATQQTLALLITLYLVTNSIRSDKI